jgi:hypothetical protein
MQPSKIKIGYCPNCSSCWKYPPFLLAHSWHCHKSLHSQSRMLGNGNFPSVLQVWSVGVFFTSCGLWFGELAGPMPAGFSCFSLVVVCVYGFKVWFPMRDVCQVESRMIIPNLDFVLFVSVELLYPCLHVCVQFCIQICMVAMRQAKRFYINFSIYWSKMKQCLFMSLHDA